MSDKQGHNWKFEYSSEIGVLKLTTHDKVYTYAFSCHFYYEYCFHVLSGKTDYEGDDFNPNRFTLLDVSEDYGKKILYLFNMLQGMV
ncbi:MAG: hypothetical protein UHG91_04480 [Succinivibrionaceae bacterium]|nr:hypothetical protein [Ruminobacter sp.]MDY5778872.1 hypothetical protein [Succinivibrionaceae bacterium]MEE1340026.1 hypothetical protein [Succinivibrionaceae bacterium]